MTDKPDNPPAFACVVFDHQHGANIVLQEGMLLRDYMAAAALQGMFGMVEYTGKHRDHMAMDAYDYADAMLLARQS